MLTVTLLLKPLVVTAAPVLRPADAALLWWLWLTLRARQRPVVGQCAAAGGGSAAALMRPARNTLTTRSRRSR